MPKIVLFCLLVYLTGCEQKPAFQSHLEEVFPPVPLTYSVLNRVNALPITPDFFRDRWTLVLFGLADCAPDCQTRLQLANRQQAVQALFVVQDLANFTVLNQLASAYPEVAISMAATAALADNFQAQFRVESVTADDPAGFFYLVNPQAELEYLLPADGLRPTELEQELNNLTSG
ncbi:MAG: hypothetical protein QNJ69_03800 [Gammaproteobacteria bacterium]|nr:hypothetical protein [Gammaproteobacteria bacterium]